MHHRRGQRKCDLSVPNISAKRSWAPLKFCYHAIAICQQTLWPITYVYEVISKFKHDHCPRKKCPRIKICIYIHFLFFLNQRKIPAMLISHDSYTHDSYITFSIGSRL